jgi:hypothetical protein
MPPFGDHHRDVGAGKLPWPELAMRVVGSGYLNLAKERAWRRTAFFEKKKKKKKFFWPFTTRSSKCERRVGDAIMPFQKSVCIYYCKLIIVLRVLYHFYLTEIVYCNLK